MATARRRKAQGRRARSGGASVRVRMYRVGFGDCFLVSFLGKSPRHVLVDCGVHSRGDIRTLADVVANVRGETRGKLALIVASHAHEDHISGFARQEDVFRGFTIGEVWLPWTENPRDRLATRLRRKRAALYASLQQHFAARPPSAAALDALTNLAAASNSRALDNLRSTFGKGRDAHYFEAGKEVSNPGGIPGLRARFLGPPRDEAFLKKMDPPKVQRFLRLDEGGQAVPVNGQRPFPEVGEAPAGSPRLSAEDEVRLREAANGSLEGLAFTLNQAMNNTSLVIVFSYRGRNLLFPGDAQYGNWSYWTGEDDGADTLSELDFYKVSHHGSENATPKSALLGMTKPGLAAMMSTQGIPWPSIPYGKLVTALELQTGQALVRSDSLAVTGAPAGPAVARLPRGFRAGRLWYDYVL